jgi:hypothetical protein
MHNFFKIYATRDSYAYWNRRRDNVMSLVQIDVYVYLIRCKDVYGLPHEYVGTITVYR